MQSTHRVRGYNQNSTAVPIEAVDSKIWGHKRFERRSFEQRRKLWCRFYGISEKKYQAKKQGEEKTLTAWLKNNVSLAHERKKEIDELKEEVYKLQELLAKRLELKEVRYDCGWNFEHYRGCLKTHGRACVQCRSTC